MLNLLLRYLSHSRVYLTVVIDVNKTHYTYLFFFKALIFIKYYDFN